ncbi:MAG TPA: hypothetical protein VN706_06565 [Gemmatimonadaceae bacterium]|nr:hypothetical protein [Gemmatimonadaceae bacterium]
MVRSLAVALLAGGVMSLDAQVSTQWPQHSMDRPQPRVVDPGPCRPSGPPPSDAVVLFDGKSLAGWTSADSASKPARWTLVDGAMEVAPNATRARSTASIRRS